MLLEGSVVGGSGLETPHQQDRASPHSLLSPQLHSYCWASCFDVNLGWAWLGSVRPDGSTKKKSPKLTEPKKNGSGIILALIIEGWQPIDWSISRPSSQRWERERGSHHLPLQEAVVVRFFLFNSPGEEAVRPGWWGQRLQAHSRQPRLFLNCRWPSLIGKSEV